MGKRQRDQLLKLMAGRNVSGGGGGGNGNNQQRQQQGRAKPPQPRPPADAFATQGKPRAAEQRGGAPAAMHEQQTSGSAPTPHVVPGATGVASASEVDASITAEQLSMAITVLNALVPHPELFRAPRYKALRAAVFPLVQPQTHAGYVSRVSEAVADGRWNDAILALHAMRKTGEVPKLGSMQRWVRDLDLAGADDDSGLKCLDYMLRVAAPEQVCPIPTSGFDELSPAPTLLREPEWCTRPLRDLPDPGLPADRISELAGQFRVLLREAAASRRPANLHDMILYTCPDNTVPMRPASEVNVEKVDVPHVPESYCLDAVLSDQEATSIVQIAERVGMTPDVPLTGKKSILAHHFVWMADEGWIRNVFDRCRPHLPKEIHGAKIHSLNRRLRCYRYVAGSVYRPHVDGAWPMSGIGPQGEYVYDISNGKVTSKLTFLMYLNEGFEGGWTTYYTPAFEEGHLKVTPVGPRIGAVVVFPHADTTGCLVHEGSGVISGAKYIIRTEVLYEMP